MKDAPNIKDLRHWLHMNTTHVRAIDDSISDRRAIRRELVKKIRKLRTAIAKQEEKK